MTLTCSTHLPFALRMPSPAIAAVRTYAGGAGFAVAVQTLNRFPAREGGS